MLSFIVNKNAPEQIEIAADDTGIDNLIHYLQEVKKDKDHMHLIIDTELNNYPVTKQLTGQIIIIKHVRLQYTQSDEWHL